MTTSPSSSLLYSEKKLAEKIGVARDDAKAAREAALVPERHWLLDKRAVVITAEGLPILLAYLAATMEEIAPLPTDFEDCRQGPGPVDTLAELEVTRIFPNTRLLQARTASGDLVSVQVRTNENFRPRMKLMARPIGGSIWKLEGNCPRQRGRY